MPCSLGNQAFPKSEYQSPALMNNAQSAVQATTDKCLKLGEEPATGQLTADQLEPAW
jgi:hypothetical protein